MRRGEHRVVGTVGRFLVTVGLAVALALGMVPGLGAVTRVPISVDELPYATLSAYVERLSGQLTYAYDWSVEKIAEPDKVSLSDDGYTELNFIITAVRSGPRFIRGNVFGTICVRYEDGNSAAGNVTVDISVGGSQATLNFGELSENQDPVCKDFELMFTQYPDEYLSATAACEVDSGNCFIAFQSLPPWSVYFQNEIVGEYAKLVDTFECPSGFACQGPANMEWELTDSQKIQLLFDVRRVDNTVCSTVAANTALLSPAGLDVEESSAKVTIVDQNCGTDGTGGSGENGGTGGTGGGGTGGTGGGGTGGTGTGGAPAQDGATGPVDVTLPFPPVVSQPASPQPPASEAAPATGEAPVSEPAPAVSEPGLESSDEALPATTSPDQLPAGIPQVLPATGRGEAARLPVWFVGLVGAALVAAGLVLASRRHTVTH